MYKNILVPIALEHERDTGSAMDVAHRLLAEGGQITALHVMEALPGYTTQYLPANYADTRHDDMMTALKAELGGVKDVKPAVVTGHAGTTIVEYAAGHDIDCIVVASHRPGLQDYLLGSTAARVVRHAACAVHVIVSSVVHKGPIKDESNQDVFANPYVFVNAGSQNNQVQLKWPEKCTGTVVVTSRVDKPL